MDRKFQLSLTSTLAWCLWMAVVVCMVLAFERHDWLLAALGCASSGAAATLHIRSFFAAFACYMASAFDVGRHVERENQGNLRSIS